MILNRLARPDEWHPNNGPLIDQHMLVTEQTLQGQHQVRAWEYSQALKALDLHQADVDGPLGPPLIADIGGAGSNFWQTLTCYTSQPITRIDPNHEWGAGDQPAQHFRETLEEYLSAPVIGTDGKRRRHQFDAVFCLSVIEHVPSKSLQDFERDLVSLVKPGGLLVLTCDAGESHPDTYHFHWMRERIYTPAGLQALCMVFEQSYGMFMLTGADFAWHGPTAYDEYTVASLAFTKER